MHKTKEAASEGSTIVFMLFIFTFKIIGLLNSRLSEDVSKSWLPEQSVPWSMRSVPCGERVICNEASMKISSSTPREKIWNINLRN